MNGLSQGFGECNYFSLKQTVITATEVKLPIKEIQVFYMLLLGRDPYNFCQQLSCKLVPYLLSVCKCCRSNRSHC